MKLFALCHQWLLNVFKKTRENQAASPQPEPSQPKPPQWIGIALPPASFSITILQQVYQCIPVFPSTPYPQDDNHFLFEVYALHEYKKNKRTMKKRYKALAFLANLNNWQLTTVKIPPKTPLNTLSVNEFCQALLNSIEDNIRHSMMLVYTQIKQQQVRVAGMIFSISTLKKGTMVSYAEVATDKPSIDEPCGQSYCFRLQVGTAIYLVDCFYCANPRCRCNTCLFYVMLLNEKCTPEELEIEAIFLYDFRKNRCVEIRRNRHRLKIGRCLAELTAQVPNWQTIIQSQYEAIKAIGKRSQINRYL